MAEEFNLVSNNRLVLERHDIVKMLDPGPVAGISLGAFAVEFGLNVLVDILKQGSAACILFSLSAARVEGCFLLDQDLWPFASNCQVMLFGWSGPDQARANKGIGGEGEVFRSLSKSVKDLHRMGVMIGVEEEGDVSESRVKTQEVEEFASGNVGEATSLAVSQHTLYKTLMSGTGNYQNEEDTFKVAFAFPACDVNCHFGVAVLHYHNCTQRVNATARA